MSQILEDCAYLQANMADTAAVLNTLPAKIADLQAAAGKTQEEADAVAALKPAAEALNAKAKALLP